VAAPSNTPVVQPVTIPTPASTQPTPGIALSISDDDVPTSLSGSRSEPIDLDSASRADELTTEAIEISSSSSDSSDSTTEIYFAEIPVRKEDVEHDGGYSAYTAALQHIVAKAQDGGTHANEIMIQYAESSSAANGQ
jgi:hypothetical protein